MSDKDVTDRQGVEHARLARSKGISREMYQRAHDDGTMSRVLDAVRDGLPITIGKFFLLADLGTITVPVDYTPVTEFAGMSFTNPSRVLKPGEQVWVRVHKQVGGGTTTTGEERLAFLKTLGSYLVGAQGIEIVHPKRDQLPRDDLYLSFDEKERLPLGVDGYHYVPAMFRGLDDNFSHRLFGFECLWTNSFVFLSFCDPALRPSDA